MGKLYAYIRVSTDRQSESGLGMSAQTHARLREETLLGGKWAMTHFGGASGFYVDDGVSAFRFPSALRARPCSAS